LTIFCRSSAIASAPDDSGGNYAQTLFDSGNLLRPYHSVNTDLAKRIRYLD
jgi:hypothetical protein